MSFELKDVVEFLGYKPEDFKTLDELKEKFNGEFVRRSVAETDEQLVGKIVGHRLGTIKTSALRIAKEFGVEIPKEKLVKDGKELFASDILDLVGTEVKTHHEKTVGELKTLAEAKGGEAVKQWQEKYGQLETKHSDFMKAHTELQTKYQEVKKQSGNTIREFKITNAKTEAFSKGVFKDGLTEVEKIGFDTYFNNKYKIDLDEKDMPYIADKSTGQRISNKAVAGTFLGIDDVYKMEIAATGLDKKNPHASGNTAQQQQQLNTGGGDPPPPVKNKMPFHPSFEQKPQQ